VADAVIPVSHKKKNQVSKETCLDGKRDLSSTHVPGRRGDTASSIECVLLLQNVFSYYRMCSLTTECVTAIPPAALALCHRDVDVTNLLAPG